MWGRRYTAEQMRHAQWDIDAALKTETICPTCEGLDECKQLQKGWQAYFDDSAADMYGRPAFRYGQCRHLKAEAAKEQAASVLVPRFQARTFDTWIPGPGNQTAFEAARAYAEGLTALITSGLIFVGPPGVGKTHLAGAILQAAINKGIPSGLVTVPKLLEEVRQGYSQAGADKHLMEKARTKRFLVLDDLGVERPTDWVLEQLYLLVNERYERQLPTVATSNYNVKDLESRIGSRVVDRLLEMCQVYVLAGRSWRRP